MSNQHSYSSKYSKDAVLHTTRHKQIEKPIYSRHVLESQQMQAQYNLAITAYNREVDSNKISDSTLRLLEECRKNLQLYISEKQANDSSYDPKTMTAKLGDIYWRIGMGIALNIDVESQARIRDAFPKELAASTIAARFKSALTSLATSQEIYSSIGDKKTTQDIEKDYYWVAKNALDAKVPASYLNMIKPETASKQRQAI